MRVLATAANGTDLARLASVDRRPGGYLARPARRDRQARAPPVKISDTPANEWAPAIAADSSGRVHVAFDTYQAGNYDVLLRTPRGRRHLEPRDHRGRDRPVMRPGPAWRPMLAAGPGSLTKNERPTGARTPSTCVDGKGSSLYRQSKVVVKVVDGERVFSAPDPLEHAHRLRSKT